MGCHREVTMNSLSRDWLTRAMSILAMAAGLVLVVAVAMSGSAIGRSVTALVAGGFVFGVLGCLAKETLLRRGYTIARPSEPVPVPAGATIVTTARFAEATASAYEGSEPPAFAPVVSLTEVQVERQLAKRRPSEVRSTLNRA